MVETAGQEEYQHSNSGNNFRQQDSFLRSRSSALHNIQEDDMESPKEGQQVSHSQNNSIVE